jgi:CheY-like chemotaxis protein
MSFQNVLLIDDDEEDAEIFCAAAKEVSAITCTVFHSATEALAKLSSKSVCPDVIFLDLNMPIMSGQKFLQEIKAKPDLKEIPIIIFSTSSQPSTIQQTKELGAKDFITKPERFDDLVNILTRILRNDHD